MPNPKRRGRTGRALNARDLRRTAGRINRSYATLSEVEDRNDRNFLAIIAKDAATNAINENKAMNIPVTIVEDGWVVRKAADGTVTKIAPIERREDVIRARSLTKGTVLHVKGR